METQHVFFFAKVLSAVKKLQNNFWCEHHVNFKAVKLSAYWPAPWPVHLQPGDRILGAPQMRHFYSEKILFLSTNTSSTGRIYKIVSVWDSFLYIQNVSRKQVFHQLNVASDYNIPYCTWFQKNAKKRNPEQILKFLPGQTRLKFPFKGVDVYKIFGEKTRIFR